MVNTGIIKYHSFRHQTTFFLIFIRFLFFLSSQTEIKNLHINHYFSSFYIRLLSFILPVLQQKKNASGPSSSQSLKPYNSVLCFYHSQKLGIVVN
ncbi:hypothetical protein VTK26DRAFT_4204 [Humicola hyalothermophila]